MGIGRDQASRQSNRPSGTVTFLFTDIEQSSKLWQSHPEHMNANVAAHDALMRTIMEKNNGYVFKTVGDAFYVAFATAAQALQAAVAAQQALAAENWGAAPIKVRMGLHSGEANERDNDYFGPTLSVVARLMSAGHGGQILVSRTTADLLRGRLPAQIALSDLGEHRLKDILDLVHIYQINIPGLPTEFAPLKTMGLVSNNLPLNQTSFIGRDNEINEVQQMLGRHHLVTLTGPGGTGKTRLSLRVAANIHDQFNDGVWLIELAPLTEAERLPQAFLGVFGLSDKSRESIETLLNYLRDKQMLIILDNCEHVIAESARIVNIILARAPEVKIVATSREVLGVAGEKVFRVPSMESPDPAQLPPLEDILRFESIRLFVDRAQATLTDFELNEQNAVFVAQICRHLDGIPFAIELAAALVDEMSPKMIAAHLDDRFALLTNRARNLHSRHLTLGALIDWGYDLLTEAERGLLRRLAVFTDGWSLEGAEAICGAIEAGPASKNILPLLGRLIKKSLVLYNINNDRYEMLETVRLYALDKLRETGDRVDELYRHQVAYYLEFLRRNRDSYLPIEPEWANLLASYSLCLKYAPENIAEFSNLIVDVLIAKGYFRNGIHLFNAALQTIAIQSQSETRAILNHHLGRCYFEMADFEKAREFLELSLSESAEPLTQAHNNFYLASVLVEREENTAALALIEKSRALYTSLKYSKGLADIYYLEAYMSFYDNDLAKAQNLLNHALDIFKRIGDAQGKLKCLHYLCYLLNKPEHHAQAEQMVEAALALSESLGELNYRASLLRAAAEIAATRHAYSESNQHALQALKLSAKFEDPKLQAQIELLLCHNSMSQANYAEGVNWGGKALAFFQDIDDHRGTAYAQKELCLAYRELNDLPAAREAGLASRRLFAALNDQTQINKVDELLASLEK